MDNLRQRYVPTPVWIESGRQLDRPRTAEEAIREAGLDFTVTKQPVKVVSSTGKLVEVPDTFATVSSRGKIIGTVGARYEVLQPIDHFSFFDPIVQRNQAAYISAGLAQHGRKLWLLAKLPGYLRIGRDDLVEKYKLLAGSFDGSLAVVGKISPIRFTCQNCLSFALRSAGAEVRIKHTRNLRSRLTEASRLLGISSSTFSSLEGIYNRMARRKVSENEAKRFLEKLLPDNPDAESSKRIQGIRNSIRELAATGVGSNLNPGTSWSLYQGVTEHVDHTVNTHNREKRINHVLFGCGEDLKKKSFALIGEMFLN